MPDLIDGHNLIPKLPGLSLRELDDELKLIQILQEYCRKRRTRVEVYFDQAAPGQAVKRAYGPVSAHFSPAGHSADAAIRVRLDQLKGEARNWRVISSDHAVRAAARAAGAQSLSAEAYARLLTAALAAEEPPGSSEAPLSAEEVESWLQLFQDADEDPDPDP